MADFPELRVGFCRALERVNTPMDADEMLELLDVCKDNLRLHKLRLQHEADKTPTLRAIALD